MVRIAFVVAFWGLNLALDYEECVRNGQKHTIPSSWLYSIGIDDEYTIQVGVSPYISRLLHKGKTFHNRDFFLLRGCSMCGDSTPAEHTLKEVLRDMKGAIPENPQLYKMNCYIRDEQFRVLIQARSDIRFLTTRNLFYLPLRERLRIYINTIDHVWELISKGWEFVDFDLRHFFISNKNPKKLFLAALHSLQHISSNRDIRGGDKETEALKNSCRCLFMSIAETEDDLPNYDKSRTPYSPKDETLYLEFTNWLKEHKAKNFQIYSLSKLRQVLVDLTKAIDNFRY